MLGIVLEVSDISKNVVDEGSGLVYQVTPLGLIGLVILRVQGL